MTSTALPDRVSVVVATRDRRDSLLRTLAALPPGPEVLVVDNGSRDGSADAASAAGATVLGLPANTGAPARTEGVRRARTPYVAFADDDSWWDPGALDRAVQLLDAHPRLGLVAARVLLPGGREDAVSRKLARAPVGRSPGSPGPDALSFPAFAAVVRREAYLATGGFSRLLFFGGEEHLLALDLTAAGWQLAYCADVVARHAPGPSNVTPLRWARQTRNDLLVVWLRLPLRAAVVGTLGLARRSLRDRSAARALAGTVHRLPGALARRRAVPTSLAARFTTAQRPLGPPLDPPLDRGPTRDESAVTRPTPGHQPWHGVPHPMG
ncbi:glycosyltransferase family 2 protein [Modestobacter sp. Leaf380]|uniref:glycosyltransferase family 2 protein n=1 Tax=Modestobacter sp. Leaf380 TaxID=1736356 RepID=UPI0009E75270|nr:glycosyltransferase [Modestobacter sp. Leaf380]